jgi:DNA-binding transcriptional regulator YdaS (Cro superfamily)
MTLKEYFSDKKRGAKADFAASMGITRTWLSLIISGREVPSASLTIEIHRATRGKVSREELRPDLFGRVK